jgi:hypothetical protein
MRLAILVAALAVAINLNSVDGFVTQRRQTFQSWTTAIRSSMEEYERQMQAASMGGSGVASSSLPQQQQQHTSPAAAAPASPAAASSSGGGSASSAASAMETLAASQTADVQRIAAAIGPDLVSNADASWTSETVDGNAATIDGRDAPGANGNISWLADTHVAGRLASLTIFNGPLTDVPHLLSQVSITGDGRLRLTLDFRPRAYGAYETRRADGSYPGPDELGREAFTYSGNRKDFDTKFGTPEVSAFVEGIASSLQDADAYSSQPPTDLDQMVHGPLYLDVVCPLTEANIQTIASARSQAVDYWLSWCMDRSHQHRPGAPINAQYVYDEKFRINAYQALLENYETMFGSAADAQKLAAADSGPLGEAYVGGGS